jgi:hypothetical protein
LNSSVLPGSSKNEKTSSIGARMIRLMRVATVGNDTRGQSVFAASSGSGNRGARIHTTRAVVVARPPWTACSPGDASRSVALLGVAGPASHAVRNHSNSSGASASRLVIGRLAVAGLCRPPRPTPARIRTLWRGARALSSGAPDREGSGRWEPPDAPRTLQVHNGR